MKKCEIWQDGTLCGDQIEIADGFFTRFRGLMLRKSLQPGGGLLLENCGAIHCCFMRFPIDVVYLDRELRIVGHETVRPWRLGGRFPGAKHVLELAAGAAAVLQIGTKLTIKEQRT